MTPPPRLSRSRQPRPRRQPLDALSDTLAVVYGCWGNSHQWANPSAARRMPSSQVLAHELRGTCCQACINTSLPVSADFRTNHAMSFACHTHQLRHEQQRHEPCPAEQAPLEVVPQRDEGEDQPRIGHAPPGPAQGDVHVAHKPEVVRRVPVPPEPLPQDMDWSSPKPATTQRSSSLSRRFLERVLHHEFADVQLHGFVAALLGQPCTQPAMDLPRLQGLLRRQQRRAKVVALEHAVMCTGRA